MAANDKISKTLRYSFLDGVFASSMLGFTQEYFAPFLILLGATARHIGMLSALPNLFSSLIQLKSADITEKVKSRKTIINIFVLLQGFMLLPIALIAFHRISQPILFIIIVILFAAFGALSNPAWASLMSDLIREDQRGSYFGWRNRVLGFVMVGMAFLAGLLLHVMKKIDIFYGFAIIFAMAFVFRVISWLYLKKMEEPYLEYKKEDHFTFIDFISNMRRNNFGKFVIFVSLMSFSVNLAAPFFTVLMLQDLHFSYLLYTLIVTSAILTIYIVIERWGRHADKVGNLKIIKLTSRLVGFIPLLWILNRHPIFLIFVQIFAGFMWAGFNLCTSNFIYDAVTPAKRTRCIAYFNVFNGIAICSGALLGGFLLKWLPPIQGYKILTLFLLSSILRLIIGFFIPPRLKEVRPVKKIKSTWLFFSMIGIRPILGIERKTIQY